METAISQSKRKVWVVVNHFALILLIVLFYAADKTNLYAPIAIAGLHDCVDGARHN